MADEKTLISKYKIFDQVIQDINRTYITPNSETVQRHRDRFQDFFIQFLKVLQQNDKLLDSYHKIQYTGSNYDGLVVGSYKEFDMDILIKLPPSSRKIIQPVEGTVQIKLDDLSKVAPDAVKILEKWYDPNDSKKFLLPDNFRKWGESVVHKSLNTLESCSGKRLLNGNKGGYLLKMKKSGPAFTLGVECLESDIQFDVDFVFCLYFEEWPQGFPNVHKNVQVKEWLAVPKTPNSLVNTGYKNWRYSFPKSEKTLLRDNKHIKSSIKLMKKYRDTQNLNYLPSYYIKTLFLWESKERGHLFWENSVGYIFVTMLMKFKEATDNKTLPFYWDKKLNLLGYLKENQIENLKATLKNSLDKIESYCDSQQPDSLKKILLTANECKL